MSSDQMLPTVVIEAGLGGLCCAAFLATRNETPVEGLHLAALTESWARE